MKGSSGSGKTTLLRTLAEMWPFAAGSVARPVDPTHSSCHSYRIVPLGDLRSAVAYPGHVQDLSDDRIAAALRDVHLGNLVGRLDERADWAKILSPGSSSASRSRASC